MIGMTKLMRDIFRLENDLMNELVKSRTALINRLREWKPERSADSTVNLIFYKIKTKGLKGNSITSLISSLSKGDKE